VVPTVQLSIALAAYSEALAPARRSVAARAFTVSPADHDGGADHVGGALLAFRASGHHSPLIMISGFSMTFMLSPPLGNPMMDAFSCSTQKMLVAFSMFT
jgi:hypothetical protein